MHYELLHVTALHAAGVTIFGILGWVLVALLLTAYLTHAAIRRTMRGPADAGHEETRRIVEEQSAIRRVATLVAHGVPPPRIFEAVATEMGRLLGVDYTVINRFDADDAMTVVAGWSSSTTDENMCAPPIGSRWPTTGSVAARVLRTGRPARMRTDDPEAGGIAAWGRERRVTSAVGCPITVAGRIWGIMVILSLAPGEQPKETEERTFEFIELIGTAIANAESRAELAAAHARVVAAGDATRRRIERNLHDGAQQRLVSLALDLQASKEALPPDQKDVRDRLDHTVRGLTGVVEELQEISRGLHPAVLAKDGLGPALKTLVRRSAIPVDLEVHGDRRLDDSVEVAVYYIVSEALTNAAKHSNASEVSVVLQIDDKAARLTVRDNGVGGADPRGGSGLTGLTDRVEALDGTIEIKSPPEHGTSLSVCIPDVAG